MSNSKCSGSVLFRRESSTSRYTECLINTNIQKMTFLIFLIFERNVIQERGAIISKSRKGNALFELSWRVLAIKLGATWENLGRSVPTRGRNREKS